MPLGSVLFKAARLIDKDENRNIFFFRFQKNMEICPLKYSYKEFNIYFSSCFIDPTALGNTLHLCNIPVCLVLFMAL